MSFICPKLCNQSTWEEDEEACQNSKRVCTACGRCPPPSVHTQPPLGGGRSQSQQMEVGAEYRFVPCRLDFVGIMASVYLVPCQCAFKKAIHTRARTHTHLLALLSVCPPTFVPASLASCLLGYVPT